MFINHLPATAIKLIRATPILYSYYKAYLNIKTKFPEVMQGPTTVDTLNSVLIDLRKISSPIVMVFVAVCMAYAYNVLQDEKNLMLFWEALRTQLLLFKEALVNMQTASQKATLQIETPFYKGILVCISDINTAVINTFYHVFNPENISAAFTGTIDLFLRVLDVGLKLGDFICVHWPAISAISVGGSITTWVCYQMNFLWMKDICEGCSKAATKIHIAFLDTYVPLGLAYNEFGRALKEFISSGFGCFANILYFPVNVFVSAVSSFLGFWTKILINLKKLFKKINRKLDQFLDWLFRPGSSSGGIGNGGNGGNGSGGFGGSGSGGSSGALLNSGTLSTAAASATIGAARNVNTSGTGGVPGGNVGFDAPIGTLLPDNAASIVALPIEEFDPVLSFIIKGLCFVCVYIIVGPIVLQNETSSILF